MSGNNPDPIEVQIVARMTGLLDGLRQSTGAVQSATSQMASSFTGMGSVINSIKAPFLAISAVMAGGAMFKGAVDETLKWTGEAIRLSRALGITTESASVLNMALGDIYVDSQTYITAVQMMTRQINSGGEAFRKLGVATRDANGNLRPSTEIMNDVLARLNGMKAGTDRNVAGLAIFGRSWGEAQKLLKLNAEVMEEARQKAERLHLIVGPEGEAQTKAYKAAMNDIEDIFQSLQVQVGNLVLPILVKLGTWLGENGPALCEAFSVALKGLVTVFLVVKAVVETIALAIATFINGIVTGIGTLGKVIGRVVSGDFSGAWSAMKEGSRDIVNYQRAAAEGVADSWKKAATGIKDTWSPKKAAPGKAPAAGATFNPDAGGGGKGSKAPSILQQWEDELSRAKAKIEEDSGFLVGMAQQDELAFWQAKLAAAKVGSEEWVAVVHRMASLTQAMDKESKAITEKSEKERAEIHRLAAEDAIDAAKAELQGKQDALDADVEAGRISADKKLETQRQYVRESARLEIALLDVRQTGMRVDSAEWRQIENQKLAISRRVGLEITRIERQGVSQRRQLMEGWFDGLTSGFRGVINGLIQGTMT